MKTDANGRKVIEMWRLALPDPTRAAAGFPVLERARHATIFSPTREIGAYNHHPQLIWHAGRFLAMWSNQPIVEDGPGQRVLTAASADGETWSDWRELFPSPGHVHGWEAGGLVHTAGRWLVVEDRLFAVGLLHDNRGFINKLNRDPNQVPVPKRDPAHPNILRHGHACMAREARPDGSFGTIFPLGDNLPQAPLPYAWQHDRELAARLDACFMGPEHMPAWDFEGRFGLPDAWDGHRLCEPTTYRAADGSWRMLLRDHAPSHRLYVSHWNPDTRAWSPGEPTDIPDAPSLAFALNLPDGTVLLIGNQTSPVLDNPEKREHYSRDPLTVSVSRTGETFDRVFALRHGPHDWNVPPGEVIGRGHGYQYPCAITHDEELWVIHSVGKERIAVSHVPLRDIVG